MLKTNKTITISGEDALETLYEIEFMLISLHKMGSYYADKSLEDYRRETTDFIDDFQITHRLAKIRTLISKNFDDTRGDDDMDDMERYVSTLVMWSPKPPPT